MDYEQLILEVDGGVAIVRMNNAEKLNALSPQLTQSLLLVLERLRDDASVRAIVLTGEGRGFCAGADLGALQEPYSTGERPKLSLFLKDGYNKLIPLLTETPKPVIAAINGPAAGAGISLALACDIRVASDAASFSMAFVRIGLIPDAGASWLLPRTIGMSRALELALTGDKVAPQRALDVGLVHQVVPASLLMSESLELARRLANLPTAAIGLTKRVFNEASRRTLAEAMDLEADLQDEAAATDDHLEGVLAFLEKRAPAFSGH